jgi:hypothetical protein
MGYEQVGDTALTLKLRQRRERALGRFIAAYFKRARPVATSDGNLYESFTDAARIDGGLRSPSRISAPLLLGAAVAVPLRRGPRESRTGEAK